MSESKIVVLPSVCRGQNAALEKEQKKVGVIYSTQAVKSGGRIEIISHNSTVIYREEHLVQEQQQKKYKGN